MNPMTNIDDKYASSCYQSLIKENLLRGSSLCMPKNGQDKKRIGEAHADRFAAQRTVSEHLEEMDCSKESSHVQSIVLNSSTCLPRKDVIFYQEYLTKRLEETRQIISGTQLFKEVQSKGYRGSLRQVQKFVAIIRKERPKEMEVAFYREYLIKRWEETQDGVSGIQLFKEIQSRGYRGSESQVRKLLAAIRRDKVPPKACLAFHQSYLIKRLEETRQTISGAQLFKEVQSRGYRGSLRQVQKFVAIIRKERPKEMEVAFYREYLIKRWEETQDGVSGTQLFKEIQSKGYRGSENQVQKFLAAIRRDKVPPKACLAFHQSYLIKRLEETRQTISGAQLFGEIQARGYRGSMSNVKRALTMMCREISLKKVQAGGYRGSIKTVQDFLVKRKDLSPRALNFHKNYLAKRIEETWPDCVPVSKLCEEIRANGYRESDSKVYKFIAATHKGQHVLKNVLEWHKDYLIEKVEAALPHRCSASELFKEISTKGYRGSLRLVQDFVSVTYKMKQSQKTSSPRDTQDRSFTCASVRQRFGEMGPPHL